MNLYLIRHGDYNDAHIDPEKGLSVEGRKQVRKTIKYLAKNGVKISEIWHSDKKRAKDTAELAAEILKKKKIFQKKDLAPLDDVKHAANRIQAQKSNILIAGHLPHLSNLATRLILKKESGTAFKLKAASILALTQDQDKNWQIEWLISPENL